jgi:sec-independent protein translocase protein TatC
MRRRRSRARRSRRQPKPVDQRRPLIEHIHELRTRAIHIAASVVLFGTAAYFVQQSLVSLLLKPAHGQHFIYTSPGGGIGFLFGVCTDVGLILSLPLIAYELLGFLAPLVDHEVRRFIARCVVLSGLLAACGVAFGYFLGLPLALHFLGHQFTTKQITPLLTISEYMSFVTVYLGGSALLFQIPLVLGVINRMKPLKPRRLLGWERYVIVGSFVVAMLMAPTTNVIDQLVIAVPVIVAYQVGVGLIWLTNRRPRRPKKFAVLVERDRQQQAERLRRAQVQTGAVAELTRRTSVA